MSGIDIINSLNLYSLKVENPIRMVYNGNTIATVAELSYDPPRLNWWDRFWGSKWGKIASIVLIVVAILACIATHNWLALGMGIIGATTALISGGIKSGLRSMKRLTRFYEGFVNYLNKEWSKIVGITSIMLIVSVGIQVIAKKLPHSECFIEGTLILTIDGSKAIEEIKVEDKVWAYDEASGERGLKEVVQLFRNETLEWCHVSIDGMEKPIVSTPGHKYYLPYNTEYRNPNAVLEQDIYEGLSEKLISAEDLKKEIKSCFLMENMV